MHMVLLYEIDHVKRSYNAILHGIKTFYYEKNIKRR